MKYAAGYISVLRMAMFRRLFLNFSNGNFVAKAGLHEVVFYGAGQLQRLL